MWKISLKSPVSNRLSSTLETNVEYIRAVTSDLREGFLVTLYPLFFGAIKSGIATSNSILGLWEAEVVCGKQKVENVLERTEQVEIKRRRWDKREET